ncbi:Uncharacterised protein [Candidatus Bilamarchaeum dharawalense]|uniref:Ribbon-helix-helix protein CopG domain-containing protein n=1 Tax=Candidatus Bilamarchaeum dharawalense TaxID=2885759 RepID=A0A5E4LPI2_9ARCH|nr:Uncharacterised protein [Candidatus Bilamarchaeum dharawalense]
MAKIAKISISWPVELAHEIKERANNEGRSVSGLLRVAYRRYKEGNNVEPSN